MKNYLQLLTFFIFSIKAFASENKYTILSSIDSLQLQIDGVSIEGRSGTEIPKTKSAFSELIINGKFSSFIINNRLTDKLLFRTGLEPVPLFKLEQEDLSAKYFYITQPKEQTNFSQTKESLQIEYPEIYIKPNSLIGKVSGKDVFSRNGVQLYDPVMGSLRNISADIKYAFDNSYVRGIIINDATKNLDYKSEMSYLRVKPIIKTLYFKEVSSSYFEKQSETSLKQGLYSFLVQISWIITLPDGTTEDIFLTSINSLKGDDYHKLFKQAVRINTQVLLSSPKFKEALKAAKNIHTHHPLAVKINYAKQIQVEVALKEVLRSVKKGVVTVYDKKRDAFGSGFFIDSIGHILTNYHVIDEIIDPMIQVFGDTSLYPVKILSVHEDLDLALLKVDKDKWKALDFCDSAVLEIGENVIAVGTPGDKVLSQSVTKGILSGIREIEGKSYLQCDASVNPGNSGGPLISEKGCVLGMVAMKIQGIGYEGLSFAIPSHVIIKGLRLSEH